jgi:hypothetical protein
LKNLTGLESLAVSGAKITDACVDSLGEMKGLRKLALADTKVSQQAVEELEKRLPKAAIARTFKEK